MQIFKAFVVFFILISVAACGDSPGKSGKTNNPEGDDMPEDTELVEDGLENDAEDLESIIDGIQTSEPLEDDFVLPVEGENGSTIDWSSSRPDLVSATGSVNLATSQSDVEVVLTATLSLNGQTIIKEFEILVKGIFPPLSTGQTACYDAVGSIIGCSNTGQDGEFQNGRTTDLNGPNQDPTFSNDYTTTDNLTGLTWRSCPQGLGGADCSSGAEASVDFAGAASECLSLNTANSGSGYAGKTNWRSPLVAELATIINYNTFNPSSFGSSFPGIGAAPYWSSNASPFLAGQAFRVDFADGQIARTGELLTNGILCVSGDSFQTDFNFIDNSDGTIFDENTNLIWQKCARGQANDSSCSGSSTMGTWQNALDYCNSLTLADRIWRLPNVTELGSIADISFGAPAIDVDFFPGTQNANYWTSTTNQQLPTTAYIVEFNSGATLTGATKTVGIGHVRCVSAN